MKKVVSGGPVRADRLPSGRCRPAGYNPVELSRFAVGIHPLVFQSPVASPPRLSASHQCVSNDFRPAEPLPAPSPRRFRRRLSTP